MEVRERSSPRLGTEKIDAALRLADLGFAVVPGATITGAGDCSCGNAACRAPGRHPVDPAWLLHASTDPARILGQWERRPGANLVAPVLGPFHIVDTPAPIGELVVDWLGGRSGFAGPVIVTPERRYHFCSPAGVAVELGVMLDRRGYAPAKADLRVHREGSYVLLPPSTLGPVAAYRWQLRPRTHVRDLPGPAMLVRLIAEACREVIAVC